MVFTASSMTVYRTAGDGCCWTVIVEKHGVRRSSQLNALDRLAFVGRNGMGALSYEPDRSQYPGDDAPLALDKVAEESAIMLAGESEEVLEELLRLSGSSAGARPKMTRT
jgi:serine/threonine-protein kinase HipA